MTGTVSGIKYHQPQAVGKQTFSWSHLPLELFEMIFPYLSARDLVNFSLCSKPCSQIEGRMNRVWKLFLKRVFYHSHLDGRFYNEVGELKYTDKDIYKLLFKKRKNISATLWMSMTENINTVLASKSYVAVILRDNTGQSMRKVFDFGKKPFTTMVNEKIKPVAVNNDDLYFLSGKIIKKTHILSHSQTSIKVKEINEHNLINIHKDFLYYNYDCVSDGIVEENSDEGDIIKDGIIEIVDLNHLSQKTTILKQLKSRIGYFNVNEGLLGATCEDDSIHIWDVSDPKKCSPDPYFNFVLKEGGKYVKDVEDLLICLDRDWVCVNGFKSRLELLPTPRKESDKAKITSLFLAKEGNLLLEYSDRFEELGEKSIDDIFNMYDGMLFITTPSGRVCFCNPSTKKIVFSHQLKSRVVSYSMSGGRMLIATEKNIYEVDFVGEVNLKPVKSDTQ